MLKQTSHNTDYNLELLAAKELKKFDNGKYIFGDPAAIPIEEIIENHYGISIEYHCLRKNMRTLGQMIFDGGHVPIYDREKQEYTLIDVMPNTMLIDIRLIENSRYENRLRFTYAHELAHYLMDRTYFANSEQSPALVMGEYSNNSNDAIERRANMLCSYFLIPTGQMKKAFNRLMAKGQAKTIVYDMAKIFGVSEPAMKIRLSEHGLLI